MKYFNLLVAGCALALAAPSPGAEQPAKLTAEQQADVKRLDALLKGLKPVTGSAVIPGAQARIALGTRYYFLNAEDARKVLVEAWGNPPEAAQGVLGMIFPAGKNPLDDTWGAVVSYEASGHVSDEDAETADYDALLKDIQQNAEERNKRLAGQGFASSQVVGWAQQPTYDRTTHTVIWARDLKFENDPVDTLNYDVRLLGRTGVLSINMVSPMPSLAEIRQAAAAVSQTAQFDAGARYADFKAGTDEEAGYGIAGLVAVGAGMAAAKKLGVLGAVLIFGKKFIALFIAALAGGVVWFRRKFRGDEEG